ncbi:hypothetical protein PVAG01_11279 [Phlyctema vagabunda]|uniref:Uncharacterized protein n=1 Tax=Phlyctema vagabunda TaxID=108571 RepID=A0ABR4P1V4_9HELO
MNRMPEPNTSNIRPTIPGSPTLDPSLLANSVIKRDTIDSKECKGEYSSFGPPVFFPLAPQRSTTRVADNMEAVNGFSFLPNAPLPEMGQQEETRSVLSDAEEPRLYKEREFLFEPSYEQRVGDAATHQASIDRVLPPAASAGLSSENPSTGGKTNRVHNTWDAVYVRTAKCDSCNKRNSAVLQRCKKCNMQWCEGCLVDSNDGIHTTNGRVVDWATHSTVKQRSVRGRGSTRVHVSKRPEHKVSQSMSFSNTQRALDNPRSLVPVENSESLENYQDMTDNEAMEEDRLSRQRRDAREAMLRKEAENEERKSQFQRGNDSRSMFIQETKDKAAEAKTGVTLDALIEDMVKRNKEHERAAKQEALEREMQDTWDNNHHILQLRREGKEYEAREIMEAARTQLVFERGL